LLEAVVEDRRSGRDTAEIARAFQRGLAQGLCDGIRALCASHRIDTVVLSGGVFQNKLLLNDLAELLEGQPVELWTNHAVPPNDGGVSLGQAALAALHQYDRSNFLR
jgi:hydrogenase maturation protein HypF